MMIEKEGKNEENKWGRTFVGVVGGHEEGGVDFETPAASLDGARGGQFGEVSVADYCVSYTWAVRNSFFRHSLDKIVEVRLKQISGNRDLPVH